MLVGAVQGACAFVLLNFGKSGVNKKLQKIFMQFIPVELPQTALNQRCLTPFAIFTP